MTKKMSTPMKPPLAHAGKAWNPTTDSTATARNPSMSGRYLGCVSASGFGEAAVALYEFTRASLSERQIASPANNSGEHKDHRGSPVLGTSGWYPSQDIVQRVGSPIWRGGIATAIESASALMRRRTGETSGRIDARITNRRCVRHPRA